MQPERSRAKKRSTGVARARMFLKDRMGWLPGFPVALGGEGPDWLHVPPPGAPTQDIRLDREALHVATRCWSKLVNRFPHAMKRAVPEPERWPPQTARLLDLLKERVHEGRPLPASLMAEPEAWTRGQREADAQARSAHPRLGPVLDALSWARFAEPKAYDADLAWITENRSALLGVLQRREGPEGIRLVLRLAGGAREQRAGALTPLIEALADPLAWSVSTEPPKALIHWAEMKGKGAPPSPAEPQVGPALMGLTDRLLLGGPGERGRALELLAALAPKAALPTWRSWWQGVEPLVAALARAHRRAAPFEAHLKRLQGKLTERPAPWWAQALTQDVERLAAPEAKLTSTLLRFLARLPVELEGRAARAPMLHMWAALYREHPKAAGDALRSLDKAWARALRRGASAEVLLRPWANTRETWHRSKGPDSWPEDEELLDELPARGCWPDFYDALLAGASALSVPDKERMDWAVGVVKARGQVEGALDYIAAAAAQGLTDSPPIRELQVAYALSQEPGRWAVLLRALDGMDWDDVEGLRLALEGRLPAQGVALLGELLAEAASRPLRALTRRLALLGALGVPAPALEPSPEALPGWALGYPEALRGGLTALVAWHEAPERAAERVLGKDLPRPEALQREIAALERRAAQAPEDVGLSKRLEGLRRRLETPSAPSPARLARLDDKLRSAASRARLERWQGAVNAALTPTLAETLGDAAQVQDAHLPALAALFALDEPQRSLGLRLLRARQGPPPWDLRDDPVNQAFLAKLEAQGVDPEAWLEAEPVAEGSDGRLRLRLEDDPLEVLRMGEHFNTCLSPGSFNFFSTVSNAADLNKRVIFGRDPEGQVKARCLLALTEEGALLCFHPYSHDASLDFPARVGAFARALAARMGTVVVPRGQVPRLLAHDWYDDGPRDLVGAFAALEEGAPLREALPGLEPQEALRRLDEALAPVGLGRQSLLPVLALDALRANPPLGRAVLERCARLGPQDEPTRLAALRLGLFIDDAALLRRLLGDFGEPMARARFRQGWDLWMELGDALVRADPAALLRALRQSRPKGVRRLREERDPGRLWWSALALTEMARPHQAKAALEAIGERPPHGVRLGWVRSRVAALEARVGLY